MSTTYAKLTQDIYRISRECGGEGNLGADILEAKESFISIVSTILANNLIIQEYGKIEAHKGYKLSFDIKIKLETLYQLRTSIKVAFQEGVIDSIAANIIDEQEYMIYALLLNEYKKFGNEGVKESIQNNDIENNCAKDSFISDVIEKIKRGYDFLESIKATLKEIDIDIEQESIYQESPDPLVKMIFAFNKHIGEIIQKDGVFVIEPTSHTLN